MSSEPETNEPPLCFNCGKPQKLMEDTRFGDLWYCDCAGSPDFKSSGGEVRSMTPEEAERLRDAIGGGYRKIPLLRNQTPDDSHSQD